jgi:hypothetical protein
LNFILPLNHPSGIFKSLDILFEINPLFIKIVPFAALETASFCLSVIFLPLLLMEIFFFVSFESLCLGFPLVAPRGGEPITYLRVRRPLYLLIFQQQIQSCVMVRDKELHAKNHAR